MEYRRLSKEEIENLKIGDIVNFGSGKVFEILNFRLGGTSKIYENGKWEEHQDILVAMKNIYTTEIKEYYKDTFSQSTKETQSQDIGCCRYCGALWDKKDLIETKIFVNHGEKMEKFCPGKPCSGYYQMGCEG